MSTEDLSPPSFTERSSGYYDRSSRVVANTDSYVRCENNNRANNNSNSFQPNRITSSSIALNSIDNSCRSQDPLFNSNGTYSLPVSSSTVETVTRASLVTSATLSTSLGEHCKNNILQNIEVPQSWYDSATATYIKSHGGCGNVDASVADDSIKSQLQQRCPLPQHPFYTKNCFATTSCIPVSLTTTVSTQETLQFMAVSPSSSTYRSRYGTDNSDKTIPSVTLAATTTASNKCFLLNKNVSKLNKLLKSTQSGSKSPKKPTAELNSYSTINSCNSNLSRNNHTITRVITTAESLDILATLSDIDCNKSSLLNVTNTMADAANANGNSTDAALQSISTTLNSNNTTNSSSIIKGTHTHQHDNNCRSKTPLSRSHSRSPNSYCSSHSSSSSSSRSSCLSHVSSPISGNCGEVLSVGSSSVKTLRNLQTVQTTNLLQGATSNPSGNVTINCGSSSSSSSSSGSISYIAANPVVHSEDNRPLAIRVRNLPARSSDTSLKDGLFHEYKKHGKVTWVKVVGQNSERYALVCFKKPDDVEKAIEVSRDKLFFGCKIEVEPYKGYDVEDNEFRPYEAELDEYHPKSTRTLFIGNLEKDVTASELRSQFECFGEIIEIDIKKQGVNAYAFCQYSDIASVVKAMRKMDGEHMGNNRIKLGFGKSMPTNCVWIDGICDKISESHLQSQFSRFGSVTKVTIDRLRLLALVLYDQIQYAQAAVKDMRGTTMRGRKLQVDFASRECQDAFFDKLDKQISVGTRLNRYESQSRSRASSFSRQHVSNDNCSPNDTPGCSSNMSSSMPAPSLLSAVVPGNNSSNSTTTSSTANLCQSKLTTGMVQARLRMARSTRHTIDYDFIDERRARNYDDYNQTVSNESRDDERPHRPNYSSGISPGTMVTSIAAATSNLVNSELCEIATANNAHRNRDKSPIKEKGDIRYLQKERTHLLEQLEECPSSGDECVISPQKRIKMDFHHINLNKSKPQVADENHTNDLNKSNTTSNCDVIMHDPLNRKNEMRRVSETKSALQLHIPHHHNLHQLQQQQIVCRRPSIDVGAFSVTSGSNSGIRNSNAVDYQILNESNISKRRKGGAMPSPSTTIQGNTPVVSSNLSLLNVDFHHHASRGRGHQLHSYHSHEASGGESADGSRPGTPLCDERPEVLPSEPRRLPREKTRDLTRELIWLPMPKFGIQFFHQYRTNFAVCGHHLQHHVGSNNVLSPLVGLSPSGLPLKNSSMINQSSLSSNSAAATIMVTTSATLSSQSPAVFSQSPSSRYWRNTLNNQRLSPQPQSQANSVITSVPGSIQDSVESPLRSRSLSSNSSDSDAPTINNDSPSLDERLRNFDEMYERWSGSSNLNSNHATDSSRLHEYGRYGTQSRQLPIQLNSDQGGYCATNNPLFTSRWSVNNVRHKFLDIDEMQPSDIVKSLLAKKSIFDDDLQRLKKNQWYDSTVLDSAVSSLTGAGNKLSIIGGNTSPAVQNLSSSKTCVTGSCTKSSTLLHRLSSLSPLNSPQASMSPYKSPSPPPSTNTGTINLGLPPKIATSTVSSISTFPISNPTSSNATSKSLQYPFPSHPPLPNVDAPLPVVQPAPPPLPLNSTTSTSLTPSNSVPILSTVIKSISLPTSIDSTLPHYPMFYKTTSIGGSCNSSNVSSQQHTISSGKSSSKAAPVIQKPIELNIVGKFTSSSSKKNDKSYKHNIYTESDKKPKKSHKRASCYTTNSQHPKLSTPKVEDEASVSDEQGKKSEKDERDKHERTLKTQHKHQKRDNDLHEGGDIAQHQQEKKNKGNVQKFSGDRNIEEKKIKTNFELREHEQREYKIKEDIKRDSQKSQESEQHEYKVKELKQNRLEVSHVQKPKEDWECHQLEQNQIEIPCHNEETKKYSLHLGSKREKVVHNKKVENADNGSDLLQHSVDYLHQRAIFEIDGHNNKENATDDSPVCISTKEGPQANFNSLLMRIPKRRLNSQDDTKGTIDVQSQDDFVKRIRIDSQSSNHHSRSNEPGESKDNKFHIKQRGDEKSSIKDRDYSHNSSKHNKKHGSSSSKRQAINKSITSSKPRNESGLSIELICKQEHPDLISLHNYSGQNSLKKRSITSDDDTEHSQKAKISSHQKQRDHGSASRDYHSSRRKSKYEQHHHRDKKRHYFADSTNTDEEFIHNRHRRMSAAGSSAGESSSTILGHKNRRRMERKSPRGSDEDGNQQQASYTQMTKSPLHLRKVMLSTDSDDTDDAKKHSIFDIPADCPNVSMYDKVKARSCKNMQKQAEEKKIKAKFSQLKQSRAKKKGSVSYDGDSDSDREERYHRLSSSFQSRHHHSMGLSSSDDNDNEFRNNQTQKRAKIQSQLHIFSDSDTTPAKMDGKQISHQNLRSLCDGEDSSDDEIRRNVLSKHNLSSKRNCHSTRIASDSESQSQPPPEKVLFKEESLNDNIEFKLASSSIEKLKVGHDLDSFHEECKLKSDIKNLYIDNLTNETDEKNDRFDSLVKEAPEVRQSNLKLSETGRKKHKKGKKRQKTPLNDATVVESKDLTTNIANIFDMTRHELKIDSVNEKLNILSPTFESSNSNPTITFFSCLNDRRKNKDRKIKKRNRLRNMSEAAVSVDDSDKTVKEERQRIKKSKKTKCSEQLRLRSLKSPSTELSKATLSDHHTRISHYSAALQQHRNEDKMEYIFGIISDEESQFVNDTDTKGMSKCTPAISVTGPVASAALQTCKQEQITLKKDTVTEHILRKDSDNVLDKERHRKIKREKKRRERNEKATRQHQVLTALQSQQKQSQTICKQTDDDNSVDLDEAGRALEAQLMDDSDNRGAEDPTLSTTTTYRSDMKNVFKFSDGEQKSVELLHKISAPSIPDIKDTTQHKTKEKKKKKKRSRDEKQQAHQRFESLCSTTGFPANNLDTVSSKMSVEVNLQTITENTSLLNDKRNKEIFHISPICRPSPSLPCLMGDDDDILSATKLSSVPVTPTKKVLNTSVETLCLTSLRDEHVLISPIPKTPTITNMLGVQSEKVTCNLSPNSSLSIPISTNCSSVTIVKSSEISPTISVFSTKKKTEIFIPGFDGKLDEKISESAVQSISSEFNSALLEPTVNDLEMSIESSPDDFKRVEKIEDTKLRVTISQEETESAVSALLGESFGKCSNVDYSLDGLEELSSVSTAITSTLPIDSHDGALASNVTDSVIEIADTEEINKAVQSLCNEDIDIKVDTPQSVRELQIDTDTEENQDEADSSGPILRIDETVNNLSPNKFVDLSPEKTIIKQSNETKVLVKVQSSVITRAPLRDASTSNINLEEETPPSGVKLNLMPISVTKVRKHPNSEIEPPTISKFEQPMVQPVQTLLSVPISNVSNVTGCSKNKSNNTINLTSLSSSSQTTLSKSNSSKISGPAASHTLSFQNTQQSTIVHPPTISIPDLNTQFVGSEMSLSSKVSNTEEVILSPIHLPNKQLSSGLATFTRVRTSPSHSPNRSPRNDGNNETVTKQNSPISRLSTDYSHSYAATSIPAVSPQLSQPIITQSGSNESLLASPILRAGNVNTSSVNKILVQKSPIKTDTDWKLEKNTSHTANAFLSQQESMLVTPDVEHQQQSHIVPVVIQNVQTVSSQHHAMYVSKVVTVQSQQSSISHNSPLNTTNLADSSVISSKILQIKTNEQSQHHQGPLSPEQTSPLFIQHMTKISQEKHQVIQQNHISHHRQQLQHHNYNTQKQQQITPVFLPQPATNCITHQFSQKLPQELKGTTICQTQLQQNQNLPPTSQNLTEPQKIFMQHNLVEAIDSNSPSPQTINNQTPNTSHQHESSIFGVTAEVKLSTTKLEKETAGELLTQQKTSLIPKAILSEDVSVIIIPTPVSNPTSGLSNKNQISGPVENKEIKDLNPELDENKKKCMDAYTNFWSTEKLERVSNLCKSITSLDDRNETKQSEDNPKESINFEANNKTEVGAETYSRPVLRTVGRPPGSRSGLTKRGRQPRGSKKYTGFMLSPTSNERITGGIQTRLRKPATVTVCKGRKGRPSRNLLWQQHQQQKHLQTLSGSTIQEKNERCTSICEQDAEKKQDVYEFHDDSGEDSKTVRIAATEKETLEDTRPRLILTINKSSVLNTTLVNSSELDATSHPSQSEEYNDETSSIDTIDLLNTRKSRRLQEKEDRSTIDDIIEDVVRNTLTASIGIAATLQLPKGAQTPPRRSVRNAQSKKAEQSIQHTFNAVGRPRRSKERKPTSPIEYNDEMASTGLHDEFASETKQLPIKDSPSILPSTPPLSGSILQNQTLSVGHHTPTFSQPLTTILQHPKKKAIIAAAEIEYNAAVNTSMSQARPLVLHTSAQDEQKDPSGAADTLNQTLNDRVTSIIITGLQQDKESNLPAPSASCKHTQKIVDPKNIFQTAVPAVSTADGTQQKHSTTTLCSNKRNFQVKTQVPTIGSIATPVTAFSKPVQGEDAASAFSSCPVALSTSPMNVIVKKTTTSTSTTEPPLTSTVVIQQNVLQTPQSQGIAVKQPIVMQQNCSDAMQHAQHTGIRPPTLKAHVLNSQKTLLQQNTSPTSLQEQSLKEQQNILLSTTSVQLLQPSITTQHLQHSQQLNVNIPNKQASSPHNAALNSPRMMSSQSQQQTLAIKQTTPSSVGQQQKQPQVLHVVSSKASIVAQPLTSTAGPHHQKKPFTYITLPTTPVSASPGHTNQQHYKIQQTTAQSPQQKTTSMSTIPLAMLALPTHSSLLMQSNHLQPQQHQIAASPPLPSQNGSLPNPSINLPGQLILGSVTSSSPTPTTPLKSHQANSAGGNMRTNLSNISPQGQAARVSSLILPSGLPMAPFESNMHDVGVFSTMTTGQRPQSPPPAHQQGSPITPNDTSFGSGSLHSVPTSCDTFMIYQMMRGDYDDKLISSSPPLELRCSSSAPRTLSVPHSLQSPQDRTAADSPQIAQVYVHSTRIPPPPHQHFADVTPHSGNSFYEAGNCSNLQLDPPPAHRAPATSISVVIPPASSGNHLINAPSNSAQTLNAHMLTTAKILEHERDQCESVNDRLSMENQQDGHRMPSQTHSIETNTIQHLENGKTATHVPPPVDSLVTLLQRYPVMWQGLLALKTDQAAVQMHFVYGNPLVARASLPCLTDGSTPPLRIAQRMRLEQTQLEGVAKKMQAENEHCILLALPCGRDHADVLQQSRYLQTGFITYLQQKMAAGIVNIPVPGGEQAAYVVHIFPSCDFANENLERAAPDLKNRVAEIAHLLIVIATV